MPYRTRDYHGPASLAEMQAQFDQAWTLMLTTGVACPYARSQQRDELAAIIVKLMQDGKNESATIAEDAMTEFMKAHRRAT